MIQSILTYIFPNDEAFSNLSNGKIITFDQNKKEEKERMRVLGA